MALNLFLKMVFQGQQKPKQTMAKSCSNLIPNIEHGNQRQKLESCNTKNMYEIIFVAFETMNMK
jgi:hypothetical protein